MFIEDINYKIFEGLYEELKKNNYEITIDDPKSLYKDYLQDNLAIRVWEKDFPLLTLEVKAAKNQRQKETLNNRITVKLEGRRIYFGTIEVEIAYKRTVLKGKKDLEDARHLEKVFKNLDRQKIKEYSRMFEDELKA